MLQNVYSEIAMRHRALKTEEAERLDLQCQGDLKNATRDDYNQIVVRYHAQKDEMSKKRDLQCQTELDEAKSFYMSMFSLYREAKIKNQSNLSIKLCKLENLAKVPDEKAWSDSISETNKKLLNCFTEYLKQAGKSFEMEFNVETNLGSRPTYACYQELRIKMK